MIDILAIDRWSASGDGWLHRASAPAKMGVALAFVGALIVSSQAVPLAVLYAALVAALLTSRLPALPVLGLSLLPVAMSALFALTRLGTTWESALVIVEKGAITSLALLLVVATTPAPELFRAARRLMPATLADILFLAYRSIFILLGRALAAREALRLRASRVSILRQLRRNALVGALAVLRATELASEQYAAMRLRGYPGHHGAASLPWGPRSDLPLIVGAGVTVVAGAVLGGQVGPAALLPLVPLLVVPAFLVRGNPWPSLP